MKEINCPKCGSHLITVTVFENKYVYNCPCGHIWEDLDEETA
uniref:Uncharacterized protein n=1 Tax=viral metagenome TaxID=1070528 RepID=A0A6M3LIX6_9ZZZZ